MAKKKAARPPTPAKSRAGRKPRESAWKPGDLHFGDQPIEVLKLKDGWYARIQHDAGDGSPPVKAETLKAAATREDAEQALYRRLLWLTEMFPPHEGDQDGDPG